MLKDAEERDIALPVEKLVVNCSPQTANATPGEISSNMARESRVLILSFPYIYALSFRGWRGLYK